MNTTFQPTEIAVGSATDTPESSYLSRLRSLRIDARSDETRKPDNTRVFFTDDKFHQYQINSLDDLIKAAKVAKSRSTSICVIEDISIEWIARLGVAWDIDPKFFATHAENCKHPRPQYLDRNPKPWNSDALNRDSGLTSKAALPSFLRGSIEYVEGTFQYHSSLELPPGLIEDLPPNHVRRYLYPEETKCVKSNTRISYCRPNTCMYLFLIDAPPKFPLGFLDPRSNNLPTLRFPCSINRGGVGLPRLLSDSQNNCSVYEALKTFSQHTWHHALLFDRRHGVIDESNSVIPGPAFIYLLASSLWEENLRYLDKEIKQVSFQEIRNPKLEINNVLHDRREDLARLKSELVKAAMHVPPKVEEYFEMYRSSGRYSRITPGVSEHLKHLIKDTSELQAFLMETFTLFMSSINVHDTRLSMDQAQRGSRLTILAFIYVPLSFVTGVFGMNIQQINRSGLNIWVCFVALVAAVLLTIPVFYVIKLHRDRKAKNDSKV